MTTEAFAATRLKDEGTSQGFINEIDCSGAGISCARSGITGTITVSGTGGATDDDAIHDNVDGEIAAVADKATPVAADHLLIEDSAASNAKKDITIGSQEAALEGVMDLSDMQGSVSDGQIPSGITRDTEWDTVAEINTATTDNDVATLAGTETLTNKTLAAANNVIGADTAVALAANGANASSGNAILGVDASGAAEGAFDVWTEAENTAAAYLDQTEADALYQPLEATLTDIADGTIAENLVNTANPWADNEVADSITASNYLPLAGGTLTAELTIDETGIEAQPTDALTDCSTFSATGGGIFYDDSEGKFKKCQDNTLSDLDTGGGSGAPTDADYLVGTENGSLSAEIVVGTTPGGDLGNTWASPSVDNDSHDHTTATISGIDLSDDVNLTAGDALTLTGDDIDFDGGATPGGDLGNTWADPSVDDDSHNHGSGTLNTDSVSADELNATGVETELEAALDIAGDVSSTGMSTTVITNITSAATINGTLLLDGTPASDHTAVGPTTVTFNAGATIAAMDLVYMGSGGKWLLTDADSTSTACGELAIATEAGTDTNPIDVALHGAFVRDDTWNWTIGATLYVDNATPGQIVATAPSGTDDVVRVVGYAVTADVIHFVPASSCNTRT